VPPLPIGRRVDLMTSICRPSKISGFSVIYPDR
jgi:hypothetical protein